MSQSHTGNWSGAALISCRQSTSGCSRSMNACTSVWRARMPFTFHVAIFITSQVTGYRAHNICAGGLVRRLHHTARMTERTFSVEELGHDVARLRIGFVNVYFVGPPDRPGAPWALVDTAL